MSAPPQTAAVVSQAHTASIHSPAGNLDVQSSGDIIFSNAAGAPAAVSVSTAGEPGALTTRIESSAVLALNTADSHTRGRVLRLTAEDNLTVRAAPLEGVDGTTVRWTGEDAYVSVRGAADAGGAVPHSKVALSSADGGAVSCTASNATASGAVHSGAHSGVHVAGGSVAYRAPRHEFGVAGQSALTIDADAVVVHADLEIEGVLTTISAVASDLRVQDAVIEVATDLETEAEAAAAAAGPPAGGGAGGAGNAGCGIVIETVPTDASHAAAFESAAGQSLFVTWAGATGADLGERPQVDVERALRSGAFAKRLDHHTASGARAAGRASAESRSREPHWDARGGALRLTRFAADPGRAGHVLRHAVTMRVAADGTLEVGRFTRALRHVSGDALEEVGDETFCPLLACEP